MFKILCLDGGGARGYFTAYMIKRLEKDFNIKVNEYFDLIVGTSTGALIAGGLGIDMSIDEILNIYTTENENIFKKKSFNFGAFSSMYSNDYLKFLIKKKYKGLGFKDVKTNIMINATNVSKMQPAIFKSWDENRKVTLFDAVLASSSAPLYFEPHLINGNLYSDGCIWANNPSVVALAEAISESGFKQDIENVKILSIGTGFDEKTIRNPQFYSWGMITWAKNLVQVTIESNVKASKDISEKFLKERYLRVNFGIKGKTAINKLPEMLLHECDKIFDSYHDDIANFIKLEREEPSVKKLNFVQKLAMKLFRL